MDTDINKKRILLALLRNISKRYTLTALAEEIKMTRMGAWKIIKKLEAEKMIKITSLGKGRTSTQEMTLNWDNVLLENTLSLYLLQEAFVQERWYDNFKDLKDCVDFTILYGSILNSPDKANDIDIINITSKKRGFVKIDEIIRKKQLVESKKIHDINFTPQEFKLELNKPNKAFIHALKTGIVLYNQDNFVNFIKEMRK